MKVCFECSEYPPGMHGGIGTLVQTLARGLVQMGHQARVVGLYDASHIGPDYEEDQGVKVWRLRVHSQQSGWFSARRRLLSQVQDWCRSGDIDLIEVPDWGARAAGWPSLPVPVVVRLSGSVSFFSSEMGRKAPIRDFILERASIRRAHFVCSNSRYIAERTQSIFRLLSPVDAVIYTPVEVADPIVGIERDPNTVIFAGTLTEKKGIISLVKSWPTVMQAWPSAKLQIWGKDGKAPSGGSMQQYLRSLLPPSLEQSVQFHGHVPLKELLAAFQMAGMAVLPSYAEGFALTPIHAMAAGCPTIYSTRGSGPELIADGSTGLLVNPDHSDQIASAIITLFQNRNFANRVGENGRKLAHQRFSWPILRNANENFYRTCIEQFRRTRSQCERRSSLLSEAVASSSLWLERTCRRDWQRELL